MRIAGSGFSYDGHRDRWYDALLMVIAGAIAISTIMGTTALVGTVLDKLLYG